MKELLEKQIVLMTLLVIVIQTTHTRFALLQESSRIAFVREEVSSSLRFLYSSRISRLYLFTVRHKVVLSSSILGS